MNMHLLAKRRVQGNATHDASCLPRVPVLHCKRDESEGFCVSERSIESRGAGWMGRRAPQQYQGNFIALRLLRKHRTPCASKTSIQVILAGEFRVSYSNEEEVWKRVSPYARQAGAEHNARTLTKENTVLAQMPASERAA